VRNIDKARSGHHRALLGVLLAAPFLSQVDATIANVATPAISLNLFGGGHSGLLLLVLLAAGIGSLYLSFARVAGPARATHAAAVAVAAMAAVSLVATLAARPASRLRGPVTEPAAATEKAAAAEQPVPIQTGAA
jgi:hypothetical protein